jgi:hypothetical protein
MEVIVAKAGYQVKSPDDPYGPPIAITCARVPIVVRTHPEDSVDDMLALARKTQHELRRQHRRQIRLDKRKSGGQDKR